MEVARECTGALCTSEAGASGMPSLLAECGVLLFPCALRTFADHAGVEIRRDVEEYGFLADLGKGAVVPQSWDADPMAAMLAEFLRGERAWHSAPM